MSSSKPQAKEQIEKLVAYFEKNVHQLKAASFNETQTRNQLIDPLFEALGWDVHNRTMKPMYLQEVIPEGRVKTTFGKEAKEQTVLFETNETVGKDLKEYSSILDYIAEEEYKASAKEATKKPDYRFRIKGQTKFFLEAKKPHVDLVRRQDAIFQVKRYGFSGRVPVAILTDFEEFRVFDCTHKPLYEKPKLGIIKDLDFRYTHYLDRFDQLFDTFSRDAVEAGSLETLTSKMLQKRTGDFALDKTFLEDLSRWRIELARDIAKHPKNRKKLNDYTLNECVQRILDRIVFFRVCEDREIEVEHTLLAILRMWKDRPGVSLYSLLTKLFQQRRELYNGLLFSPHECEELEVGDKVMLEILENLNYPFSPYHFNEIGVEILGSIYEKFLGKTIHMTAKTVRVDEKPEVRKAGGVYYTPQYIVNYIVDNTVGKLLYDTLAPIPSPNGRGVSEGRGEGRKLLLSPKQVAKLKIIDIACGSGSFLLGAFQKLIDYHTEWYTAFPKDIQTINGVPDAYTDANGNLHCSSRKKRDILVNNIYGVDIDRQAVEVTQMSLYLKVLEGENAETLNPQMTLALKEVYLPAMTDNIKCGNSLIGTDFAAQGNLFDADEAKKINPFDWETEFPEIMKSGGFDCVIGNPPWGIEYSGLEGVYISNRYRTAKRSVLDSYPVFIEGALNILKRDALIGYITPDTFLRKDIHENLRSFLFSENRIIELVETGPVFSGVRDTWCLVFIGKKGKAHSNDLIIHPKISRFIVSSEERLEVFGKGGWSAVTKVRQSVWIKRPFMIVGYLATEEDQNIIAKLERFPQLGSLVNLFTISRGEEGSKFALKEDRKGNIMMVIPKDIERFSVGQGLQISASSLTPNKVLNIYKHPKIWVIRIQKMRWKQRIVCALDLRENSAGMKTLQSIVSVNDDVSDLKYVQAILASKLINFWCINYLGDDMNQSYLSKLPIRTIDFTKPEEKKMHDNLVALVDTMLELHKQLQKASFDSEKEPIERQIAATDTKIDRLVYQLYGLTEEEIAIVEGGK